MRPSLARYRDKRRSQETPEPAGDVEGDAGAGALRFVVQKHDARRLHYDFRLEVDGVFVSWAVPKGPSLDPSDERLAVQTEDHPLAYGGFEGTIPKGAYGGGTVLLWDAGTYVPEGDPADGVAHGRLAFSLEGEKLKGRFHLVRLRGAGERSQWLLISDGRERSRSVNSRDEARAAGAADLEGASVKTGRSLKEISTDPAVPAFVEPELCAPVTEPPAGDAWLHEPKIDGYRILARKDGDDVKLFTRRGLDWTARFPAVARAVAALPCGSVLLDSEVAVVDAEGASSFQALQRALGGDGGDDGGAGRVALFVFDCLFVDGRDLRDEPLLERKRVLSDLLGPPRRGRRGAGDGTAPLRLVPWVAGNGAAFLDEMKRRGFEGMVSKRADAPYRSERSDAWRKLRLVTHEEFVVVGYTPLTRGGDGVGALLVAGEDLIFRGKVGTGFTERERRALLARLAPHARATPARPAWPRVAHAVWVEPRLVVEVAYREITGDGRLRQPSYLGVRRDKTGAPRSSGGRARGARAAAASNGGEPPDDVVAGVRISNPGRVLFRVRRRGRESAVTKGDVARYVDAVAPLMLPYAAGRPLAVVRCPTGLDGSRFFQKHRMRGMPQAVGAIDVGGVDVRGGKEMLAVHDAAGLVGLVQMGVLEFHCWGAARDAPERPDRVVFDLDPDEGLPWARVVEAARVVRARLEARGLHAFALVSGGKGVHVVAPLAGPATWDEVRRFAREVATSMEAGAADRFTANMRKAARAGRVFVDHLRNGRGATAIVAYSPRARPGAPVAVPVSWDELDDVRADSFNVLTLHDRLSTTPDPWARYEARRRPLPGGSATAHP